MNKLLILGLKIGNKRFVSLSNFKGKTSVDIREFYEKNGEMCPGKKGKYQELSYYHSFLF